MASCICHVLAGRSGFGLNELLGRACWTLPVGEQAESVIFRDATAHYATVSHQHLVPTKANVTTERILAIDLARLRLAERSFHTEQRSLSDPASLTWRLPAELRRARVLQQARNVLLSD
jgi:hypothetical protein